MTDRTERVEMRLTPSEKALIHRAARYAGLDLAVAIRQAALAWARLNTGSDE